MTEMPSAYVRRVHLVNWRSFRETKISLTPGLNVFVGANNAGKSNLIEAVNLILGDVFLARYVPPTTDYHGGTSESFEVAIEISLARHRTTHWAGWATKFLLFDSDDDRRATVVVRCRCSQGESPETEFWDGTQWSAASTFYLSRSMDFYFARAIRDIQRHTPTSFRSPFQQIRKIMDKNIGPQTRDGVRELMNEANSKLMDDPAISAIKEMLQDVLHGHADLTSLGFSLGSQTESEMLRNLGITGVDTFDSAIETKGTGSQNAVILALFQILARHSEAPVVFAFEEPEIGFHPQGQRQVLRLFKSLAKDAQVLLTTHSPNLVDQSVAEGLKRFRKVGGASAFFPYPTDAAMVKNADKRIVGESTELLFSNGVLLVEGPSELGFFPAISTLVPDEHGEVIDFDRINVSVVQCGGKGEIPKYMELAHALSLPCHAIVDHDKDTRSGFLKPLVAHGIISQEQFDAIPEDVGLAWTQANSELLDKVGCSITKFRAFEDEILEIEDNLAPCLIAVNAVRESYGKDPVNVPENGSASLRDILRDELRSLKGRRLGFEIGSRLESLDQIPLTYAGAIKSLAAAVAR